ncbi:lysozyme inhibitor LprI family protein, partial [Candidatus Thiothrix sp. Deng01]
MNILKSLCILGMATTALAMAASGQAASFDCAKATTKVEKAICADDGLSSLDDEMAAAYKLALKKGNASKIKSAQKDWLQERNSCASDDSGAYANMQECIKEQYNYRLFDLNRMVYL